MTYYRGVSFNSNIIPVTGASVNPNRNLITVEDMGSISQARVYGGAYSVSGTFDGAFRRTKMQSVIDNLFGQSASNGITTLPSNPSKELIISDEYGHGLTFPSAVITSMDLSLNVKEYAKASFGFVAIRGTHGATTGITDTADYTTEPPYAFYNASISLASSVKFTGVTIKIERPIDQDYYVLGSEFIQDFVQNGTLSVSGSLTMGAKDWGLIETALNYGSDTIDPDISHTNPVNLGNLVITLNDPKVGGTNLAKITVNNLRIADGSVSAQGRNRFEKTINWRAAITAATDLTITAS